MGGGPRTYPGGVSKWQWKGMQARKAKQLLKARLARERQLYEMRKRAELRDAVAHLERPWDPDTAGSAAKDAPNLLSVAADDQLKALADRFYRPGSVDLWNDRDGPQVFASPDTGRASARFFPKNTIQSVQPYALLVAGGKRAQDVSGNGKRAQGVRENAAAEDVYGDREPTVEFMERDGMSEPVNALDGGDDTNPSDWSWNDDDVISGLEDMGDVGLGRERQATVRRDGRKGGVARWEAPNAVAVGSDDDRDRRGLGFFSDSEGAREGHLEQRWSETSIGSRRKRPTGRWKALSTEGRNAIGKDRMGGGSFSDSEVIGGGFEPKWRARNRVDKMSGAGRWKVSYDGNGNVIRKEWIEDESDPNSDSGRDVKLEPKWKAPNRFNGSESRRGRPEVKYDNANANNGDRPRRCTRGNNGGGRDRFGNGVATELEEPTWKPRRKNRSRKSNDRGAHSDDMSGRFGRGGNGSARWLEANPMNTYREHGSEDGRHRMSRNGGRRFSGDGYSLRPTSVLHSSGREGESDEM